MTGQKKSYSSRRGPLFAERPGVLTEIMDLQGAGRRETRSFVPFPGSKKMKNHQEEEIHEALS